MTATAAILGIGGLALTFASQEIGALLNVNQTPIVLQIFGGTYVGWAMTCWVPRSNP